MEDIKKLKNPKFQIPVTEELWLNLQDEKYKIRKHVKVKKKKTCQVTWVIQDALEN